MTENFTQEKYKKLSKDAVDILPQNELEKKISQKKELNIKIGFDPTAPDLHLGHWIILRKLKDFQDLGYKVIIVIGDFTAMIGDPTGRSQTRKILTKEEVQKNAQTYQEQVFQILEKKQTEFVYNSKWLDSLSLEEIIQMMASCTVAQMLERDDFSKRYKSGKSISMVEFLYPILQAYDSVVLKADIELGGTDQKFNLLMGRDLQIQYKQEPQIVMTLPLLVGLDGKQKMSKSYNNHIGIFESPYNIFSKLMSLSDELMWEYFPLLSNFTLKEIESFKAQDRAFFHKKALAKDIVAQIYTLDAAQEACSTWEDEKSHNKNTLRLPPDTPIVWIEESNQEYLLIDLILKSGLETSKTKIRKLIESNSIRMGSNLDLITDPYYKLSLPGKYEFKIGKKRYLIVQSK